MLWREKNRMFKSLFKHVLLSVLVLTGIGAVASAQSGEVTSWERYHLRHDRRDIRNDRRDLVRDRRDYARTGATCVQMCETFARTGATMPLDRNYGPTGARSPVIAAS